MTRSPLHVDLYGPEHGPKVLLVMGFGLGGAAWRPQLDRLRKNYRVCTLDNRGSGQSLAHRPGRWRMADFAEDILAVCEQLQWDAWHLVGVSMGGMIAQHVALAVPHRVKSLALIATHAGGPMRAWPTARAWRAFVHAQLTRDRERKMRRMAEVLYPRSFVEQTAASELLLRAAETMPMRLFSAHSLSQLHAVWTHDTRKALANLRVPTLILKPARDVLVHPRGSDELHAHLPHATLHVVEEGGHGCIYQCADEVFGRLDGHIRTHDADLPIGS